MIKEFLEEAKEKGEADAPISSLSNAARQKDYPVYHHKGADDTTGHACEQTGQKSVSHKFKLQRFKHFILSYQFPLPGLQLDSQFCLDNLSLEQWSSGATQI